MMRASSLSWRQPLGFLGLIATLPGLLGAAEVLLVGEELSTLGDRMRSLTHEGGVLGPSTGLYPWAPLIVGAPGLAFSLVRLAGAIGLLLDWRGAPRLLVFATPFALLIDAMCGGFPLGLPWTAFDLFLFVALWRYRR